MHVLNEACPIFIYISHYEQCVVSLAQQNQKDGDVKLYNGLCLRVQFIIFPFELFVEPLDEFAVTVD